MTDQKLRQAAAGSELSLLRRTIESEVIPRLILAHRRQGMAAALSSRDSVAFSVCSAQVEQLCGMVRQGHDDEALAYVQELESMGVDRDALYVDLLAPAARWFGVAWENENADFLEVTVALRRLQKLARELAGSHANTVDSPIVGRRALILTLPGEQHVFGTQIVVDMLRRARWDVWDAPGATEPDIITLLEQEWFAVVGLSISSFDHADALSGFIRRIRRSSLNRDVCIMVGGRAFDGLSGDPPQVGADVIATDGRDAVRQAEQVIQLLGQRN